QGRVDPAAALVGASAALEVAAAGTGVEVGDALERVHAALGGGQYLGVDVGGKDAHRRGHAAEGLAGGDRHGVGLLAGGGGARPEPDRAAGGGQRLQLAVQVLEVVRLAEEGGEVGGQGIGEGLPLVPGRVGLEHVQ